MAGIEGSTHTNFACRSQVRGQSLTPTRHRCYVEGQTIVLEFRWAEGRSERMSELMAELVGLNVDVLVTTSSPGAQAAKNATQTIPIVMVAVDPVGLGLVASLSRPGGN